MGGYHGAEVCDLVRLYLLSQLTQVVPASPIDLDWVDGLCVRGNLLKTILCVSV